MFGIDLKSTNTVDEGPKTELKRPDAVEDASLGPNRFSVNEEEEEEPPD